MDRAELAAQLCVRINCISPVVREPQGSITFGTQELKVLRDGTSANVLPLHASLDVSSTSTIGCLLQAITLLDILARVDRSAWKQTMKLCFSCSDLFHRVDENEALDEHPWVLGCTFKIKVSSPVTTLSTHMLSAEYVSPCDEELLADAAEYLVSIGSSIPKHAIPMEFVISPNASNGEDDRDVLTTLKTGAQCGFPRKFLLTSVCVAKMELGQAEMCLSKLIAQTGVAITEVAVIRTPSTAEKLMDLTCCLQSLIPSVAAPADIKGIRKLNIDDTTPVKAYPALFSVIQHSTHLDTVLIRPPDEWRPVRPVQRQLLFGWIAYSLFSSHASHSVEGFVMEVYDLERQDEETMIDAILNPLQFLSSALKTPVDNVCMYVRASTFYSKKTTATRDPQVKLPNTDTYLLSWPVAARVLRDQQKEKVYCVLVPGLGRIARCPSRG